MTLFLFLTVVQAIIAAALVGVILMQRSEGGGLGIGGSPTGMLSARGAADFLTRTTRVLAILFVVMSIVLAGLAVNVSGGQAVETTLERNISPAGGQPDPLADPLADPLGGNALGNPATGPQGLANDPLENTPAEGQR